MNIKARAVPPPPDRRDNLEQPVTELHGVRGRFSGEASDWAPSVPGELGRAGIVAAFAACLFTAGVAFARWRDRA